MSVVICVLKLMEIIWTISTARVHIEGLEAITNMECISQAVFSILIIIPIVVLICKKLKDKNDYLITSIVLIVSTIIWIFLVYKTFKYNYPINLKMARITGIISSIVLMLFSITKGYEILEKDDIDITEKGEEK